ncbi:MAG: hypothetical protein K2O24_00245 [Muribaculaceae bacterium]|nr:hypothetical protein [Muribaculaceae bacterium]
MKYDSSMVMEAVDEAKKSTLRRQHIPMEYVPGLPMLSVRGGELCMILPWLRYRATGKVDGTLVFPVRYITVCTLPERMLVEFRDLAYDPHFAGLDFGRACGTFRHEAVKDLDRKAYMSLRENALTLMGRLASAQISDSTWGDTDEKALRESLSRLIEPSLSGIYRHLEPDFYNKYLSVEKYLTDDGQNKE